MPLQLFFSPLSIRSSPSLLTRPVKPPLIPPPKRVSTRLGSSSQPDPSLASSDPLELLEKPSPVTSPEAISSEFKTKFYTSTVREREREMVGVYDKQAEQYALKRPKYPKEWFSMVASLTPERKVAWDAGTGSGQAAISLAKHYDKVIATDVSAAQLEHATRHPKVHYLHTPISISKDEFVAMLGGDDSIDLIVSASAVHWFDLPFFYSVANRVLKKPQGIIAVWTYTHHIRNLENRMKMVHDAMKPYMDPRTLHAFERYKTLPFPFESIGFGTEGSPMELDMEVDTTLDALLEWFKTWSPFIKAAEQGVDLLSDEILEEMKREWGDSTGSRKLVLPAYMLVGKPKSN